MIPYNFHSTKARHESLKTPLPEDINAPVEKMIGNLKIADLDGLIVETRKKKLYGTVYHFLNGMPIAELSMHYGMIPRFELIGVEGVGMTYPQIKNALAKPQPCPHCGKEFMRDIIPITTFKRSIYNDNISTEKRGFKGVRDGETISQDRDRGQRRRNTSGGVHTSGETPKGKGTVRSGESSDQKSGVPFGRRSTQEAQGSNERKE